MIEKYKNALLATFYLLSGIAFTASAFAETCATLYKNKDYEKAIPLCVKEESYFTAAYSYGEINDCENMEKYYRLEGSANSLGNLGMDKYYGSSGCEKDIVEAEKLLKEAVEKGLSGYGYHLGRLYEAQENNTLARNYYLKAITPFFYASDWSIDRARSAFYSFLDLIKDPDEKKDFLIKQVDRSHETDWQKEKAEIAVKKLIPILDLSEKIDLFLNNLRAGDAKCDFGDNLYSSYFTELISELKKNGRQEDFINSLCERQKEYFMGLTFENGFGNKEDFREAYRLYLIAGSKGNNRAKKARDRVRGSLSAEQLSQATCLADYGIDPGMYGKWKCDW